MYDPRTHSLGTQFKTIRTERGYSASTVADGILSVSTLYKFEENDVNLSFIKVVQLLEKMHVDLDDFVQITDSNFNNEYQIFLNQMNALYSQNKLVDLEDIFISHLHQYQSNKDHFDLVCAATTMALLKNLNHNYPVNQALVSDLTDYLLRVGDWQNFQITVFGNCLTIISSRVIDIMAKELITQHEEHRLNSKNSEYLLLALVNTIDAMIDRKDFIYAKKLVHDIESMDIPEISLLARFKLNFLKNLLLLDAEEAKKSNGALLLSLDHLGSKQLAAAYQAYMNEFYSQNN